MVKYFEHEVVELVRGRAHGGVEHEVDRCLSVDAPFLSQHRTKQVIEAVQIASCSLRSSQATQDGSLRGWKISDGVPRGHVRHVTHEIGNSVVLSQASLEAVSKGNFLSGWLLQQRTSTYIGVFRTRSRNDGHYHWERITEPIGSGKDR